MGEGTTGIETRQAPEQLEREIEAIRGNLQAIVKELEVRRHELLDWRLQLKRHATTLSIAAGLFGGIAAGVIILTNGRNRRRERPIAKAQRIRRALARIVDEPEKVARPTHQMRKRLARAAATAAIGLFAKAIAQRVISAPRRAAPPQKAPNAGDRSPQPQRVFGATQQQV